MYISDNIFDNGLAYATTNGETLYITSAEATTYAEASATYKLGTKASATVGSAVAGATDGRRVIVSAITDGTVNTTGTATHWALCKDSATSELLATGALSASQGVTSGNTFTLDAISITIRDAA
jgi:hypothetical protein